jgi:hypothetical protein
MLKARHSKDWAANAGDLAIQPDGHYLGAASKIRLENRQTGGWKQNKWLQEETRLVVPPGYHFEVWVGLSHRYERDTLQRHAREKRIGILVFSILLDEQTREVEVRIT